MKKDTVAIYCRLSKEDKNKACAADDSNSIQNQRALLTEYALSQGWEIYEIYIDDDYSGANRSRPAFNHMLQAAEERKFNIILCKTQSRFSRELEVVERYINRLFPQWGIRFLSLVDNADSENEDNLLVRQINGIMDERYLADMSKNILSVLTHRRKSGFHIGSFALYGYKKDPDRKGHLIIDEEAAAVVREVFALFSQDYGKTAIARLLNDRGIPNPTEYKRLHGIRYQQPKHKNSTLWKYFAISNMLTNEIYIGNMVQGKYGSISYKTKQTTPQGKVVSSRGDARANHREGIVRTGAKNADGKGKALSCRHNRSVCTQGTLCGMWLYAPFLQNRREILSAMPESSHFQGSVQGRIYLRGASGADGLAGITYDFRSVSESG